MTLTELKKKIADWAKKHGYKDWRLSMYCGTSLGEDIDDSYTITLSLQKSKKCPDQLTANGSDPEWCLKFLQTQWDALTEEQKSPDIGLE